MILGLFGRKKANRRIVDALYRQLTAAGRAPMLYEDFGAPDTVMGRFEMIAAHMVVFFRRTGKGSPALRDLAQEIVDVFFEDLDHSIREIGIGDMGVPKRMKKLARMFYGRYESYAAAIDAGDRDALAAALARNVFPQKPGVAAPVPADMSALAAYLMGVAADLDRQGDADILAGRLDIAAPSTAPAP